MTSERPPEWSDDDSWPESEPRRPDWRTPVMVSGRTVALLVLGLVLAVGVLGGIAADRWLLLPRRVPPGFRPPGPGDRRSREDMDRRRRAEFDQELGITPAQSAKIDSIVRREAIGAQRLRDGVAPQMDSIFAETRRAIDSVLTPEQRERLAKLRERRGGGRGGFDGPRGRGGGPGMGPSFIGGERPPRP